MHTYISLKPYLETVAWADGIKLRFNHLNCESGEDTRKRLYITGVVPEGTFIGHCFNCGGSGVLKNKTTFSVHEYAKGASVTSSDGTHTYRYTASALPLVTVDDKLSLEQRVWLYNAGLTDWDIGYIGIRSLNRHTLLQIPFDPSYENYTLRGFDKSKNKYTNYIKSDKPPLVHCGIRGKSVVLTEDVLSAYRVYRDTGKCAVACLGTSVGKHITDWLVSDPNQPKTVIIWFDKDRAGQAATLRELRGLRTYYKSLGIDLEVVIGELSPKECTPEDIRIVLEHKTTGTVI